MSERTRQHGAATVAVALTLVILLGMCGYTLMSYRPGGAGEAYLARVRQAIDGLPDQINGYQGREQPPVPAAVEMLRPNRLLQREYKKITTGEAFSVLIVHCGDVRDMQGHFPPICYPSAGWKIESVQAEEIERTDGGPIPITRYRISREDGDTTFRRVIANTFILPRADRPLGRDDRDLDSVTRTRWSSGLGAAQVQIITPADMDEAIRQSIERSVANELERVISAVTSVSNGSEGSPAGDHQREGS